MKTCYQQGDQLIVKSNYIAILNNLFIEFRAAQVANLRQQRDLGNVVGRLCSAQVENLRQQGKIKIN